jgi:hypothetical protein
VLSAIGAMPFIATGGRYIDGGDGKVLCCWVDKFGPPHHVRLANIRRENLPPEERGGDLTALVLKPGGGLAEQTHIVIFENQIVGYEFNFYGPRPSALSFYLHRQQKDLRNFVISPLIRKDVHDEIMALSDVTLVRLKLRASHIGILAQADESLADSFKAAQRAVGGTTDADIELILRGKKKGRGLDFSVFKKLVGIPSIREELETFKVKGYTDGATRFLDVLSEQYAVDRLILRDVSSKAVNSESAYQAIRDAYSELENELIVAAELTTA